MDINIVYSPQTGPDSIVFPPEDKLKDWDGPKIINAQNRKENAYNIGMGWYSIRDPQPEDSILVIEPYCVLDIDYDIKFLKKFNKIFTWAIKAFENTEVKEKVIEINHPSCKSETGFSQNKINSWLPWKDRANEIVFIANNKSSQHDSELYSLRLELADYLHKHSKYKVSWYAQIPIKRDYYRGTAQNKEDILNKVKFSVCTENCYDSVYSYNYFTEKLPDAWFSGTVPIYMGCYNIDEFGFNKDTMYIDLRTYYRKGKSSYKDFNSLIARIEGYEEKHYLTYLNDLIINMKQDNGVYYQIDYNRMYRKMMETFNPTVQL
jgi:hypothetical protein